MKSYNCVQIIYVIQNYLKPYDYVQNIFMR